eukprot:TRINITY_DN25930_c0_g1_i1.p1 TRINITY_DN25930_c0_g1~~TRINITY_DN25930_c0_g1_i1.p1  ORF type:complete len:163 (+),score=6.02 TRINITY_DN25930_c0_g1_i1:17-505(+)
MPRTTSLDKKKKDKKAHRNACTDNFDQSPVAHIIETKLEGRHAILPNGAAMALMTAHWQWKQTCEVFLMLMAQRHRDRATEVDRFNQGYLSLQKFVDCLMLDARGCILFDINMSGPDGKKWKKLFKNIPPKPDPYILLFIVLLDVCLPPQRFLFFFFELFHH